MNIEYLHSTIRIHHKSTKYTYNSVTYTSEIPSSYELKKMTRPRLKNIEIVFIYHRPFPWPAESINIEHIISWIGISYADYTHTIIVFLFVPVELTNPISPIRIIHNHTHTYFKSYFTIFVNIRPRRCDPKYSWHLDMFA